MIKIPQKSLDMPHHLYRYSIIGGALALFCVADCGVIILFKFARQTK